MNARPLATLFVACLVAGSASAQDRATQDRSSSSSGSAQATQPRKDDAERRGPPPQAYEDCKGKKAGDTVQHTTPEGKVPATCEDSPKGLVARPTQRKAQGAPSPDAAGRSPSR